MMVLGRKYPAVRVLALLVFAILNLLDVGSTQLALRSGLQEANLLPGLLLTYGGAGSMYAFKAATALLVALVVLRVSPRASSIWYSIHLSNLILATVVALNLVQLLQV